MCGFEPLHEPTPWPAPEVPPPSESEEMWRRVPLVGRLVAGHMCRRRYWRHVRDVLQPIERQIVEQLKGRCLAAPWANAGQRTEIVRMIGEAVAKEKFIDAVAIHPDDPVELLFWGAYDDMTPLQFALALHSRFGITVSCEDMLRHCQNRLKVKEVVEDCLNRIKSAPGAA